MYLQVVHLILLNDYVLQCVLILCKKNKENGNGTCVKYLSPHGYHVKYHCHNNEQEYIVYSADLFNNSLNFFVFTTTNIEIIHTNSGR